MLKQQTVKGFLKAWKAHWVSKNRTAKES